MIKNGKKTIDDRMMEKIFDINEGLYEIPTSIGNLFVDKKTLKNDKEDGYDNKKILMNIYKDDDTIFSRYFSDYRYYLGTGEYGGYGNRDEKYGIDFPEFEVFKKLKFDTYGYERKNSDEITVYLDKEKNKQYRIVSDGIRLYEGDSIIDFYKVKNNKIINNNSIGIDLNSADILININGKFVKINNNENIEEKLNSYVTKLNILKKYLQEDMKEINDILNIKCYLKIGEEPLSIKKCKKLAEKLKDIRLLYLDAYKILNYKHDEQIKREIASGLNDYYQYRKNGINANYIFNDDTNNLNLINKLLELNNGFYFVNTLSGLIEIDVNLDKSLEIIFNDEVIFEMTYREINKNLELDKNITEDILKNINKVLEKQNNTRNKINEMEKEREIKLLEKRLNELRNK